MQQTVQNTRSWIASICERFSSASGWPLSFLPVDPDDRPRIEAQLADDEECCWYREVHDGTEVIGFLHFSLPGDVRHDRTYLATCDLADLLAEITNKLACVEQSLSSRSRELTTLVDIGLALPREENLILALKQLLQASVQLTGFRCAGFFLLDPDRNALRLRVQHSFDEQLIPAPVRSFDENPPDAGILTEPYLVLQKVSSPELGQWMPEGTMTAVCLAVSSQNGPIGSLWAFDRRSRVPSDREIHVLKSLAAQIATVIERVVLRKESETQHRLARELRVVTDNQTGTDLDQVVNEGQFQAAARCLSRHELGGDVCEFIRLDENRMVIAIGDASGDSIPAAIVMTAVRGALRTITSGPIAEALDTRSAVERINRALHAITPAHQFMSFNYGILDTRAMQFTYTNAGHPPPILLPQDEREAHLTSHGMLLGVDENAEYDASTIELRRDDKLILFTDGIIEAMSKTKQMFRNDGILAAIEQTTEETAPQLLATIWNDFELHSAGGSDPDDRSLMVICMT